ncbi:hypothetical protein TNCT_269831 [Trichonephila clavata]|uniref:Uncharacterized protein n=1 Tax=Trichonephila clavata TaxID=2740835 RepID=A0A8X6GDV7_TRICU|nr:hypothetical protein TNCT_269831 [Trichonephila clavata]
MWSIRKLFYLLVHIPFSSIPFQFKKFGRTAKRDWNREGIIKKRRMFSLTSGRMRFFEGDKMLFSCMGLCFNIEASTRLVIQTIPEKYFNGFTSWNKNRFVCIDSGDFSGNQIVLVIFLMHWSQEAVCDVLEC